MNKSRGFYGIGIFHPKKEINTGTLFRTAQLYNANFIFTIGRRYNKQSSDTGQSWKHIPLFEYQTFDEFLSCKPKQVTLIGVELNEKSKKLDLNYIHPERACYLLGAEDHGLPTNVMEKCNSLLQIPYIEPISMNVSVAGSIIIHDRYVKGLK